MKKIIEYNYLRIFLFIDITFWINSNSVLNRNFDFGTNIILWLIIKFINIVFYFLFWVFKEMLDEFLRKNLKNKNLKKLLILIISKFLLYLFFILNIIILFEIYTFRFISV